MKLKMLSAKSRFREAGTRFTSTVNQDMSKGGPVQRNSMEQRLLR